MKKWLASNKKIIFKYLTEYLKQKVKEHSPVNAFWSKDVMNRLLEFTKRGKMLRGSLVILTCQMLGRKIDKQVIKTAVAIELFHSALLIHDDIMDKSGLRRSLPTIHVQYEKIGKKNGYSDAFHFGQSCGICIADIAMQFSAELLGSLKVTSRIKESLIQFFSREMASVGLAQLNEMSLGYAKKTVTKKEIMAVYTYKTARYTISLPMALGAILSGKKANIIEQFERLGEAMGILFQIRDDELGLVGKERGVGKSVGIDITENKKTLLNYYLFKSVTQNEAQKLKRILGTRKIARNDLKYVVILMNKYNVFEKIAGDIKKLSNSSRKMISKMKINNKYKIVLIEMLNFIIQRNK